MLTLITSCGRPDLLQKTVSSYMIGQQHPVHIIVHEDDPKAERGDAFISDWIATEFTGGIGQHKSIERFLDFAESRRYYVHLEDDWHFTNSYDWIAESVKIMERNPNIIKVLCRDGSPHPCRHDRIANEREGLKFGILHTWNNEGITWGGFSWNPGVTRIDLLRKFMPFRAREQDVAKDIWDAGYRVAELSKPIYKHIGDGRSTHE